MENIKKGKITCFRKSHILIEQDDGNIISVPWEKDKTVRALKSCFGNAMGTDQEIFYSLDIAGVFDGFAPVKEATPDLLEAWEKSKKEENEF